MLRDRKPSELFRCQRVKPRPARYNGALFRKRVVFLKRFKLFSFKFHPARKKNVFAAWKASLKLGGSCGVRGKRAVAISLLSASQWSLPSASDRKTSLREKGWSFFMFGQDTAREDDILATRKTLISMRETCTFVNGLWLAHHRPSGKRLRHFASQRSLPSVSKRYKPYISLNLYSS